MTCGDYPSEALIHRLADTLETDEDELLFLAEKIPQRIRERVLARPDAFRRLANLDDATLDGVCSQIGVRSGEVTHRKTKRIRKSS